MRAPRTNPQGPTLTITGAGRSATVSGEALQDATRQIRQRKGKGYEALTAEGLVEGTSQAAQLALPFPLDQAKLTEFLTRWVVIEDEEDRLREDKRLLKEEYADDFPMRGVLTAVKRVRALHKLEAHPKEGIKREHLATLEELVEAHLAEERRTLDDLEHALDARLARGARMSVNTETGEVMA